MGTWALSKLDPTSLQPLGFSFCARREQEGKVFWRPGFYAIKVAEDSTIWPKAFPTDVLTRPLGQGMGVVLSLQLSVGCCVWRSPSWLQTGSLGACKEPVA